MTYYGAPTRTQAAAPPPVRPGVLWAGGAAAALVAALVAAVGYLIVRGLFKLEILGVGDADRLVQPSALAYMSAAALAALLATALLHLLLLFAPQPRVFFGWIVALGTIVAMLYPLMIAGTTDAAIATAVVNMFIGLTIGVLVGMSSR